MVINTLNENGIPNQSREEAGGISVAMPLRATPGPGVCWAVLVPQKDLNQAKHILSELPIEIKTDADAWDFSPSEKAKRGWQIYAWIVLGFLVLSLIMYIIQNIPK